MQEILILNESVGAVRNSNDLFKKIKSLKIDYNQENLIVFYLNTKNHLIGSEIVFKGGLNCCTLDAKTIFRKALKKTTCSIIIAHNHPSGDLSPSEEDIKIAIKLKKCGKMLDLTVLDNIIFNKNSFYSFLKINEVE